MWLKADFDNIVWLLSFLSSFLDDDDDDNDDIQILVRSENAITSSVHNSTTADNLILIENSETQPNGGSNGKKSSIFT